jgi:hypothetical protein
VIDQELSSTAAPLPATDVSALASEAQIIAEVPRGKYGGMGFSFDKYYATVARLCFSSPAISATKTRKRSARKRFCGSEKSIFISGSKLISNVVAADRGEQGDGLSGKNASRETRWKRGAHLNRCAEPIANRRLIRHRKPRSDALLQIAETAAS